MTEALSLRPVRVDDAAVMVAVLADPALYQFTGGTPPTEAELERRYAAQTRGYSANRTEEWLNSVVLVGAQRMPVGYVQGTIPVDGAPTEVSWVIGRQWQGRGYARRASELLVLEVARRGVRSIVAHIHPEHEASQRIASRLGMVATSAVVEGEVRWEGNLTSPRSKALLSDVASVSAGHTQRSSASPSSTPLTESE